MAEKPRTYPDEALREKPGAEPPAGRLPGAHAIEDGGYMPPPANEDGKTWVRTSVLIRGEASSLWSMWLDVQAAPLWQERMVSVTPTGDTTSHWVMETSTGRIEWDAEVLAAEPGRRIAWRSTGGDAQHAGEVVFEPAPGGRGTYVPVLQEFGTGKLAGAWETVVGRNPKQMVIENLRHFKALAETVENARTHGLPHGPRMAAGVVKAAAYSEMAAKPPGLERLAS